MRHAPKNRKKLRHVWRILKEWTDTQVRKKKFHNQANEHPHSHLSANNCFKFAQLASSLHSPSEKKTKVDVHFSLQNKGVLGDKLSEWKNEKKTTAIYSSIRRILWLRFEVCGWC